MTALIRTGGIQLLHFLLSANMCRKPLVFMKGVLPNNASARAQCSRHTNIFPNVNKLILTRAGYENGYDVDDEFWSQIED